MPPLLRLAVVLALMPLPVQAQDGGEEQQRCVWSCLANSPGADSAEYNACVRKFCEDMGAETGAETAPPEQSAAPLPSSRRPEPRPEAAQPQAATSADPAAPALPTFLPPPPAAGWTFGRTADGRGMFAGVTDPAHGSRMDWLCAKGMPSLLAIQPYAGKGRVVLTVGGRVQDHPVQIEAGRAFLPIGLSSPLFVHLAGGTEVEVTDDGGTFIGRFAMEGAGAAIGQAEGNCR